jgi:lipoyl(octanoyl) transferase
MEERLPTAEWRILRTPPADGAWNMAVDEAILESVGRRSALPTLRLYAWQPACLSLGYAQPFADADLETLALHGWQIVRRPTGGRAILHTDELTYSVIAPLDEARVAGGVLESYRRLSQALVVALQRLGLPAQAEREYSLPQGSQAGGPVCFEVPSNYEITVAGKKLIGSAQARKREGVLQHGSLPICGDLTRITLVLKYHNELSRQRAAERLLAHAANAEMLGASLNWAQCAQAFEDAFRDTLQLRFVAQDLSPQERQRAQELVQEKYGNTAWTQHIA